MTHPRYAWLAGLALAISACHPPAGLSPPTMNERDLEPPRFAVLAEPEDPYDMADEDTSDMGDEEPYDAPGTSTTPPPVENSTHTPTADPPDTPGDNAPETVAGRAILAAINTIRASNGLGTLAPSHELRVLAKEHCTDMVTRHYFNHTTPDGKGPIRRLRDANVAFSACGETSHYPDLRPQSAIADWLRHPGGKVQMLDGRFTLAGVGIAYAAQEKRYYVNVIYLRP
jgi:uncharacterized protein YkwD